MNNLSYRRHRFPGIDIQQAVWLYFRFALSYRDVEDMFAERGIDVSYETVRRWALKFGAIIARKLRRGRPRPHEQWHAHRPAAVRLTADGNSVFVAELGYAGQHGAPNMGCRVCIRSLDGKQPAHLGSAVPGFEPGQFFAPHGLAVDSRGDLYVAVTLITPTNLTREQRRILEELAQIEGEEHEDKGLFEKVKDIFS